MKDRTSYFRSAIALASACLIVGCAQRPAEPTADRPTRTLAQSAILFAPVRVKIHPLTRFVWLEAVGAVPHIEAHVELLDRWGLPVRALGELRFVARFSLQTTRAITTTDPGFTGKVTWSVDMTDPERNAADLYDRITRTYRISLTDPILQLVGDEPFTLEVTFATPGLMVLPASMQVVPVRRSK
jgi:hypothetical protein